MPPWPRTRSTSYLPASTSPCRTGESTPRLQAIALGLAICTLRARSTPLRIERRGRGGLLARAVLGYENGVGEGRSGSLLSRKWDL